jgi:hypothetical protein
MKNVIHSIFITVATAAVAALERVLSTGIPATRAEVITDVKVIAAAAAAALCAYVLKLLTAGSSAK